MDEEERRLIDELVRLGIDRRRIVRIPMGFRVIIPVTPDSETRIRRNTIGLERRNGGGLDGVAFFLPGSFEWELVRDRATVQCLIPLVKEVDLTNPWSPSKKERENIFQV